MDRYLDDGYPHFDTDDFDDDEDIDELLAAWLPEDDTTTDDTGLPVEIPEGTET